MDTLLKVIGVIHDNYKEIRQAKDDAICRIKYEKEKVKSVKRQSKRLIKFKNPFGFK